MIKVSDYIVKILSQHQIDHIFMIVGGGAMHLNDSVIKQKKIKYICTHHEQAATMAAECYARFTHRFGVVLVTSGAGMTNTMTGLIGAWWDSIPVLILSGNAKTEMLTYERPLLRQLGVQDTRIVDIVKPITKYSAYVQDPYLVRYHMEKAIYLALNDRKGPVWIDVPLDVQSAEVDETKLIPFVKPKQFPIDLSKKVAKTIEKLKQSKIPVIIAGSGIRATNSFELFHRIVNKLKIPVLTSLTAQDLMYENHPYYGGRFGPYGTKKGNELVKKADCMLILSDRLYLWQIGYNYEDFGKNAYKIMVDVDKEEVFKPTLSINFPIIANVKDFLIELEKQI